MVGSTKTKHPRPTPLSAVVGTEFNRIIPVTRPDRH